MKRIWIWLSILLIGCMVNAQPIPFHYVQVGGYALVPIRDIPIYIDVGFGESDKVLIDDAIMQWNYALNGYIKLHVVDTHFDMDPGILERCRQGNCWVILKIDSRNLSVHDIDSVIKRGTPEYHALAWVNDIGGYALNIIRDRMDPYQITGVVMHEMGHLLGAVHLGNRLMQPHFIWNVYRCVDIGSLHQVAKHEHLPFGRLNYCIYED